MAIVLLVENEDQVRVLAESYLEEQGYTVLTAASKDGALAILESSQAIDVLFVDLGLKDEIDGGLDLGKSAAEGMERRQPQSNSHTSVRGLRAAK